MLSLVFTASLALALGASPEAAVPAVVSPAPTSLPVQEVTVFSDRARVTRQGELAAAAGAVRLALLPPTLDTESVRVTAEGAQVKRVEVRRAGLEEFPRTEAEQLIKELEATGDALLALEEKKQGLQRERSLLQGLRPTASPQPDPKGVPVLLEAGGWKASVSWFDAREAALEQSLREVDDKVRAQRKKLAQLAEKAQLLAAGSNAAQGWLVEAWLEGKGVAKVSLTYVTFGARWYPAYDVRYVPGKAEVEVGFAALATQQTGEDWTDARMIFSTAVPATTATLPKMLVWKIGERDRFIPTPVARPEPPAPRPPMPVLEGERSRASADQQVRARLLALAGAAPGKGAGAASLRTTIIDFEDSTLEGELARPEEAVVDSRREYAKKEPPPPPPPPAPSMAAETTVQSAPPSPHKQKAKRDFAAGAPASMSPMEPGTSFVPAANGVSINGPSGWSAPSYASDLPASLAGGYDFAYPSARRESLRSGPESRRVALHSAKLPAAARLAIYPALKKAAYLVADVTNASDRPLLAGNANLFVGADLQGQARLPTTAAGEKLTLPLGVDEGVQFERNVNVVTKETGFVSKDDVTTYEVVVELLNPRSAPVEARIVDQVPLAGEKTVDVKLDRMEPWAIHDKVEGSLEWRLTLPPGAKQVVKFAYTVTRPRGAKLRQW
ncbi:MAG: mucoidy inhibitor MuiA family protein [Myxococcales bacterium]